MSFESWALVELFGHTRMAGLVTECEVAGGKFMRIDVPELAGAQALTRLVGPAAIYSITPVTEETARALAREIRSAPVTVWDAKRLMLPGRAATAAGDEEEDEES